MPVIPISPNLTDKLSLDSELPSLHNPLPVT